jgi:predicted dehydrogenase
MRICFIGEVGHVQYALTTIKQKDTCKVVGVAPGSDQENVEKLYDTLCDMGSNPVKFESYIDMLDTLQPDIAVVSCIFKDHAKVSAEALQRGIHVFVEKPIATTLEDLAMLRSVYQQSGRYLAPMFGMRYSAPFLTAWQEVQNQKVGKIRFIHVQKSYKFGERDAFFKQRNTYGGSISWVGSHAIDLAYWFSGEQFKSVVALQSTQYNQQHGEMEMSACCQFQMTNEVFATINLDYFRPSNADSHADDRIRVVGTRGVIEVRHGAVYLINDEQLGEQSLPLLKDEQIFEDFLNRVQGHGPCRIAAEDAFTVTNACLQATASADQGKIIVFE